MTRSGRFTKLCAEPKDLAYEATVIFPTLKNSFTLVAEKKIHPSILVSDYLISINNYRKGKNWQGSSNHWLCSYPEKNSLIDFWGKTLLRGIPAKVNRTLINWHLGHYNLELIHHVPTASEMLKAQAEGKRFVTLFNKDSEWQQNIIHERDHFSFLIHDLIHAHEFFSDEQLKIEQINFYRMLQNNYHTLKNLSVEAEFHTSLDYLIADMNSHPAHLQSYFQGLLKRFGLTQYNLSL